MVRFIAIGFVAAVIVAPARSQEAPAKIQKLLDAENEERDRRKEELVRVQAKLDKDIALLKRMQGGQVRTTLNVPLFVPKDEKKQVMFQSNDVKKKVIAFGEEAVSKGKSELAALKTPVSTRFEFFPVGGQSVGDIGFLGNTKALQVIDKSTMIVIWVDELDQKTLATFMVKGFSTAGLVDRANITKQIWKVPMEVTGTITYKTAAGGTNTVFVLEPFDVRVLDAWRDKLRKAK